MTADRYEEDLARIEAEVEGGNTGLAALGFWRLVRKIKKDPTVAGQVAERAGRIDETAFRAGVSPLFPVWLGNGVLLVASIVALVVVALGLDLAGDDPEGLLPGLLVLAGGAGLSATVHCPAHWVAGALGGMRFVAYFLNGPLLIQPGIKVDYATYLRASARTRAWMHAAGALASKAAPLAVFAWVYLVHRGEGYDLLPAWSLWALLVFAVIQIVTDAVWSTRRSDWKKVRRELRVASGLSPK